MKNKLPFGMLLCGLILLFQGCETDDIKPTVTLTFSTSEVIISEAAGTANIQARLNSAAEEAVTISISTAGSAMITDDYTLSSSSITIPAGNISGTILLTAVQDMIKEGNETVDINIVSISGAEVKGNQSFSITIEDDDVAATANLIINEVLFDPTAGSAGDANGDGSRDPLEDEFIEFYNASTQSLDISGYKMYDTRGLDDQTPRHIFPANTVIPSRSALVLFGGGTPTGTFGGSILQTATGSEINLTNSGDIITITNASDSVILTFEITAAMGGNGADESYTRNPDITGDFEKHSTNTPLLFSPGTKIDGTSF